MMKKRSFDTQMMMERRTKRAIATLCVLIKLCFLAQLFATEPEAIRGPSTNLEPFVVSSLEDSKTISIVTANIDEPLFDGYRMVGQPDGLGAFDNGDQTFTVLMNHYMTWAPAGTGGIDIDTPYPPRVHGGKGSFVSKWVINKPTHQEAPWAVQSGEDLITSVQLWDKSTSTYLPEANANILVMGSATLAAPSAFYHPETGKGTTTRLYTVGEELPPFNFGPGADRSDGGRAFAVAVDGPDAGTAFELPVLGNMPFENVVPNPHPQDLTVVLLLADEDAQARIYVYVGDKKSEGNDITKAGLTDGTLYGLVVDGKTKFPGDEFNDGDPVSLVALADLSSADHQERLAAAKDAQMTIFTDMEDGDWDPANPNRFYFTTNGSKVRDDVPTRLWRVTLTDITNPALGGVIDVTIDGTDPDLRSFDNISVDYESNVLVQEDDDTLSDRLGKIWRFHSNDGHVEEVATHNALYFDPQSEAFLSQDDESTGIIDASEILGDGWYLLVSRAHIPGGHILAQLPNLIMDPPIYAPGQLMAMFLPPTRTVKSGIDVVVYPLAQSRGTTVEIRLSGKPDSRMTSVHWDGFGMLEKSNDMSGGWQELTRESPYVDTIDQDEVYYRVATQLDRPVDVYIPANYDPKESIPLIVGLHGYTGNASDLERQLPMKPLAESEGFIYALPNGLPGADNLPFWNALPIIQNATGSTRDDVTFLRGLIEGIRKDYNIDSKRIYFLGYSNGGMMSYRMACEHSDLVAAIVSVAGATVNNAENCLPSEPVNILHIHGTADTVVPYGDMVSPFGLTFVSAMGNIERWGRNNGCGEIVIGDKRSLDLDLSIQGLDTVISHATDCANGSDVELWTIEGGTHFPTVELGDDASGIRARMIEWLFAHPKP